MINNSGVLIAPVNVRSELAPALGRSTGDVGQLCGDVRWNGSSWVSAGGINPMAKYKSVRHSKVGILTESDRISARYGFDYSIPTLTLTNPTPVNDWVYQPPRGMNGGGTGVHEWYRVLDFVKSISETSVGYDSKARAPIAMMFGTLNNDDKSIIQVFGNSMVNAIDHPRGFRWYTDRSLSLQELFYSYTDGLISFLLIDTSKSGSPRNLIITNTTISYFASTSPGYSGTHAFEFYAQGQGSPGATTYCPPIPVLQSASVNDDFLVIVCIVPSQPVSDAAYRVISSDLQLWEPLSLGFVSGCDRVTGKLTTGALGLDGLDFSVNIQYNDAAIEESDGTYTWRAYQVTVNGVFDTTGCTSWGGMATQTARGYLTLDYAGGGMGDHVSSMVRPLVVPVSVELLPNAANQSKVAFTSEVNPPKDLLWKIKTNPATTLSATLTIDYPLTNSLTKTASTNI